MKKISALAVAALFSAATPAIVFAQAAPAPMTPGVNGNMTSTEDQTNDENKLTEGLSVSTFTEAVSVLDRANSVTILDASAQIGGFDLKPSDLEILRAHIASSVKAQQALEGAGLTADQVVGIDAADDGAVTLYVNG